MAETAGAGHYAVRLERFEGPLDLLLHLVLKNEVDIYDIPIATITAQYLDHLALMKAHQIDVASEFLVMAATLLHIKSRTLLPRPPVEDMVEEVGDDPRAELVQRLLEYRRYKESAAALERYPQLGRDVFARPALPPEVSDLAEETASPAALDVSLFDLVEALRRVLREKPPEPVHLLPTARYSLAQALHRLRQALQGRQRLSFAELFAPCPDRGWVVMCFLAMLELVRLRWLRLVQLESGGALYLQPGAALQQGRWPDEGLLAPLLRPSMTKAEP